jgi:AcrR family transcriptional regulator
VNAAHTKATRADWLRAALDVFTSSGVEHVKVQPLAAQLGVGRASFYWYFTDRAALLDELQQVWAGTNTASILDRSARPADTITAAVLGLFECWADPDLFDHRLEFAVREWARRDDAVRGRLERADARRIEAIAELHRRYGDTDDVATVRARVQYHSQIGMYALGVDEPVDERLRMVSTYVRIFTGVAAKRAELAAFERWVRERSR